MRAYESARAAAMREQEKLDEHYEEYRKARKRGVPADEDEEDWEEQLRAWDDHLSDEWHEAETVKRLVVEAFTIALHHLWERQVKAAMADDYVPDRAFGWLKGYDMAPRARQLTELKYAAETLKHSDGPAAEELFEMRSDLFDPKLAPTAEDADYESIRITDEIFRTFFEAVRKSGPQDRKIGL